VKVRRGTAADGPRAFQIWRDAVDATHRFLTPQDRVEIDAMVEDWLPTVALWMVDDGERPVGFLVMDGDMIDALFVDPAAHGRGFGTALLRQALALAPAATVDASEQASNALPFYLARGFEITGRSETDPREGPIRWCTCAVRFPGSGRPPPASDALDQKGSACPARMSAPAQASTIASRAESALWRRA
jgi:putative acetyltransferase